MNVGVVTVGRSDYGIYRPVLRRLTADPAFTLSLFVAGGHLSEEQGWTVREIECDGFPIAARIEMLPATDTAEAGAAALGRGVAGFGAALAGRRPDLLLVLGDRFEMFAAAAAATILTVPIAHLHGGEVTEGAIDEAFRHGITKMSHLHFVSTADHGRRVRQLGEEPWRVVVSGAPSLDTLQEWQPLSDAELERRIGLALDPAPVLVTFHPATLEHAEARMQVAELLAAIGAANVPAVFTLPNVDTGSSDIIDAIRAFVGATPGTRLVANLGTAAYFSLMARARAMIGNSSSGIIEAPSFALPVVNVGRRQQGRTRACNVVDVVCDRKAILAGIRQVLSPEFRDRLVGLVNPYGDGRASERIVNTLRATTPNQTLLIKRFVDYPV